MSYKQIAQDYFESSLTNKLPQDFKSAQDKRSDLDVHAFTQPEEFFYGLNQDISTLSNPEYINHLTMFMLFSAAASGESL